MEPTCYLRFIPRGGRLILQQQWQITTAHVVYSEWRDVPLRDAHDE